MTAPDEVRDRVRQRTDRLLADLRAEWGVETTKPALDYGPKPWYPDSVGESVDATLEAFAGMASVLPFYTDAREEAVLVFNRSDRWEPPGGAVEGRDDLAATAVREAREETGLDVEITDLLYATRVRYHFDDGDVVELPVATFVGRRTGGDLHVERTENDHPGVCRGVGLFGADVLPANCRDRELILSAIPE